MGNINKYFGGVDYQVRYDYHDKKKNVTDYVKYMLNRSLAMFHYSNLPETIPQMELEKMLQVNGFVAFAKVNGELYAFNGGLGGVGDVYNRPTQITISNPYLNYNATLEINKECVVMSNDSMQLGLLPMYEKYCTMLNESDISIILATINKRIQILLSANDDNTVQSAKQFLNDIENGKLGVIAETKLFDSLKVNNSANSSNVNLRDLFELHQYIKASMYNEIGLGSNNNLKREHLLTAEVEVNSDNLYPLVDDMLESRRSALEKVNEMFGTDIQVEFNSSWDYRLYHGEPIDTTDGDNMEETEIDIEPTETTGEDVAGNEEPVEQTETNNEPTETDNKTDTETSEESEVDKDVENTKAGGSSETSNEDETVDEQTEEPTDEQTEEPQEESTDEPVEKKEETTDEEPVEEKEESEVEESGTKTDTEKDNEKDEKDK